MSPHTHTGTAGVEPNPSLGRARRAALWLPGLLVALGAGVATAHGLYEVARAAGAPPLIAGLYPLITDGLALVAYAATARLPGPGRGYAWTVVVLAAGLSGLAQASYMAEGVAHAPAALRFGLGAWPALAAAIVAHLLYLIALDTRATISPAAAAAPSGPPADGAVAAGRPTPRPAEQNPPAPLTRESAATYRPSAQPSAAVKPEAVQPGGVRPERVQSPAVQPEAVQPEPVGSPAPPRLAPVALDASSATRSVQTPARDRARRAAEHFAAEKGELPTVTRLMELAEVSRGTAGEALKTLREHSPQLHLVDEPDQSQSATQAGMQAQP